MFNSYTGGKFDVVQHNDKHYYIDTSYTFDHGWETMIFLCDKNGKIKNWNHLYVETYQNISTAMKKHEYIKKHISEFI